MRDRHTGQAISMRSRARKKHAPMVTSELEETVVQTFEEVVRLDLPQGTELG